MNTDYIEQELRIAQEMIDKKKRLIETLEGEIAARQITVDAYKAALKKANNEHR